MNTVIVYHNPSRESIMTLYETNAKFIILDNCDVVVYPDSYKYYTGYYSTAYQGIQNYGAYYRNVNKAIKSLTKKKHIEPFNPATLIKVRCDQSGEIYHIEK